MGEPISIENVSVDRALENEWIEQINSLLVAPWGPNEIRRQIDLKGRFLNDGPIVEYIRQKFEAVGWKVEVVTPLNALDKFMGVTFYRPGSIQFANRPTAGPVMRVTSL